MKIIKSISTLIGTLLIVCGWLAGFSMAIYALFESFAVVSYIFGDGVAFLSLVVAPVLLAVAPLYVALSYGDWSLLLITYGAIPVFFIFGALSSIFLTFGDSNSED
tara:strand:+ start:180 stop:497 length:318 start_codon:yes stop_codon:yes gene_type:complete